MYGYPVRGLNFIKILGGISKTLNVANQVIPIYNKAKPMISNTRTILNTLKNINITDTKDQKRIIEKKKESISDSIKQNNPIFFI